MDTMIELEPAPTAPAIRLLPEPGAMNLIVELEKIAGYMDRGMSRADRGSAEHDLGRLEVGLCVLRAKDLIAHGLGGNTNAAKNKTVTMTVLFSEAEDPVKFGKVEAGLVTWIKGRFPSRSYETIRRWTRWAEKQIPKILALKQQLCLELDDVRRLDVSQLAEPQRQLLLTTIADQPTAAQQRGPANGKPAKQLTPDEQVAIRRTCAAEDWMHIEQCLKATGAGFMLLDDLEVETEIAFLETHLSARKRWVNTPPKKRDPREIEDFLKSAN